MKRIALLGLLAATVLALPAPASAGWGIVELEVGAKGGAGGNLWTQPTRLPAYVVGQDWAFSKQRGGWAGGAGLYAQLRLLKCLGIEVDLLVQESRIREHPLDNYPDWMLYAKNLNLHLPILVQGILPLKGIRIGVGIGPEFVWPLKSTAMQTGVPGGGTFSSYKFKVDSKMSTNLVVGLNFTPVVGPITIPVDLRATYNLTQAKDYEGRVTWNDPSTAKDITQGFTLHYMDTWEFRLLIDIGYSF